MESIIHWFSRNHVAANFLMLLALVLGIMTWPTIKKEIFPETSIDALMVTVPYPTATPEEVERGVIVPIEEAIQDLDGIETITSTANQNVGTVQVEVQVGYDLRELMDDVKTRIDAIQNLAEEAEEPVLEELLMRSQVVSIAISADTDESTLRTIAEDIRSDLLAYRNGPAQVTQATLANVRDYEISIEVSEDTLRQYGLTFDEVATAVRASSLDLPGGSVRTASGEVLIRTESRRYRADEFAPITVVTRPDGSAVKLSDIARIRDGFEEDRVDSRFDGRPAILLNVFRVGNQDTLKIADTVKEFVYEVMPKSLPDGVSLELWKDDSLYLSGRLKLLAKNGLFGLILVAAVLALFLRPSLALLVALGIPVSFCGAIWMMPMLGVSINMISLFAFILVLGIVVDDAIVVGENVYSRMRRGEDPKEAAFKGTHEVGVVVIFGVVTTMMAFTPMLGLSGVSGKIWPNIPLVVIPVLLFSLFQSKLILPSHLALLKRYDPDARPGPVLRLQRHFSRGLEVFVERFYRPAIRFALANRYFMLTGFISVFLVFAGLVGSGWVKSQFFPEVEADVTTAKLKMSQGVAFEETAAAVARIEEKAFELNELYRDREGNPIIRHMLTSVGTQPFIVGMGEMATGAATSSNLGEVTLELQPAVQRDVLARELSSKWRELVGEIPGAVELVYSVEAAAGGNAIDIELRGNHLEELEAAAEDVKEALGEFDGVIDITDSNLAGKRELKLEIKPSAEALGLRLGDVARQVRQGFYGELIQRLQRGKNEVEVFVRYPRDQRKSIADLETMKIRTADGSEVPFSEVATATFSRAPSSIQRTDQQRSIRIAADVDKAKGTNANEVMKALTATGEGNGRFLAHWWANLLDRLGFDGESHRPESPERGVLARLAEDHPGVNYEFQGEQKDQAQSIAEMGQKFLLALLGMYVLMAIPLRSYVQPLIIMSAIPFGLVGAILGHLVMGLQLSIMSMCGIIALAGVVVNDSLVLVDYINRGLAEGKPVHRAALAAGMKRFRPIILTSLTTFAGLTPMLLETDLQAKFLIPMAVSLGFGILFATTITLFLVPCAYLVLDDFKRFLARRALSRSKKAAGALQSSASTDPA